MKTTDREARDVALAQAIDRDHTPVSIAAQRFGVSRPHAHRLLKHGRELLKSKPADTFAASPPAVGGPGGAVFSEMATSGLRRFGGNIDEEYDRVFKSLYRRLQIYKEMGDDPIVAAVLQAVRMTVRRVGCYAEAAGETAADQAAAEFLDQCKDDTNLAFSDIIDQALDMFQYGFSLAEIVYKRREGQKPDSATASSSKYDDGRIGWRKFTYISPESLDQGEPWIFDDKGGLQGYRQTPRDNLGGQTVTVPIDKSILFRTTVSRGNPEGRAICRAMYRPWYMAHNLEEIEAISAERFGNGLPTFYLGEGTSRTDIAGSDLSTFHNIGRNIRIDEQMSLVIPYKKMGTGAPNDNGVLFELVTPNGGKPVDLHQTISRHEQRIAMVGLAQFIHLGMNQVGAKSLGESTTDFFTLAVSGWVDSLYDTINRYAVSRLFRLNLFPGLTAIPILKHEPVANTNLMELAEFVNKLVGAQVITPSVELERTILDMADLPEHKGLDEIYEAREQASQAARDRLAKVGNKPASAAGNTPPAAADEESGDQAPADSENAALISEIRRGILALEKPETFGEWEIPDVKATEFLSRFERLADRLSAGTSQSAHRDEYASLAADIRAMTATLTAAKSAPQSPVSINLTSEIDSQLVADSLRDGVRDGMAGFTPVADAIRESGERQAALIERMAELQAAPQQGVTPVVNVTLPDFPTPVVNVNVPPMAPVINLPAPVVNVTAEVVMPTTQDTIEIERDDNGLMKRARKTTRRAS